MKISLPKYLFLLEVLEAPQMCCLCFSVQRIKDQLCQKPMAFFLVSLTIDLSLTSFPPINPYMSLSFKTERVYKNLELETLFKLKVFRTQSTQIILKERKTNIATVMLYCSYNNCNVSSSEGLFLHLPNLHMVVVTAATDIIGETTLERTASIVNIHFVNR